MGEAITLQRCVFNSNSVEKPYKVYISAGSHLTIAAADIKLEKVPGRKEVQTEQNFGQLKQIPPCVAIVRGEWRL